MEYTTNNTWIDQRTASLTEQDWKDGLEAFQHIPQFFENPLHLGSIWSGIVNFIKRSPKIVRRIVDRFPGVTLSSGGPFSPLVWGPALADKVLNG